MESVIFQLPGGCREITPNCFHWGRVEKVKHPVLTQGACCGKVYGKKDEVLWLNNNLYAKIETNVENTKNNVKFATRLSNNVLK